MKSICSRIPSVTGLMSLSCVFSLMEENEECEPWINSNYILPFFNKSEHCYYLAGGDAFGCNPLITYETTTTSLVPPGLINDFIKQTIEDGKTVFTKVDCRGIFWAKHRLHDVFVVGYDDTEKVYLLLGPDLSMRLPKWKFMLTPYKSFENGYQYSYYQNNNCLLIKLGINNSFTPQYDSDAVKTMTLDLLESRISMDHFDIYYYKTPGAYDPRDNLATYEFYKSVHSSGNMLYGLQTYHGLCEYLNSLNNISEIDFTPFKLLLEYSSSMKNKSLYISHSSSVYLKYNEIENKAAIIFNLLLKGFVKKQDEALNIVKKRLLELYYEEEDAAESMLKALSQN